MKVATFAKSLGIAGLVSLSLLSGASQADPGYYNNSYANPWLQGPGYQQQMYYRAAFRQQVAQFDQRLDLQLQRILAGMESGRLNMHEAVGLLREHVAINNQERQYLADGRLGPNELMMLDQRLDHAGKHIFFEKFDADGRRGPDDRRGR